MTQKDCWPDHQAEIEQLNARIVELSGALNAMIEGEFHSGGAPDDHPLIKRAQAALQHIKEN